MTDFADWPLGKRLDFKVTEALMQSSGDDVTDGVRALTILLSEPELVASLSDEVRRSVLTPRERAVMKLGEATLVLHAADDEQFGAAIARRDIALEAARALPPSPAPMEGRSNDNK